MTVPNSRNVSARRLAERKVWRVGCVLRLELIMRSGKAHLMGFAQQGTRGSSVLSLGIHSCPHLSQRKPGINTFAIVQYLFTSGPRQVTEYCYTM